MPAQTTLDPLNPPASPFDATTGGSHRYVLRLYECWQLEAHDTLFATNSCVLLPDYDLDASAYDDEERITGLAVLYGVLKFAEAHPELRAIAAGHTDTTGSDAFNADLSLERAQVVVALCTGDRDGFVELCRRRHRTSDIQQILAWLALTRGWRCDPDGIDDDYGPRTTQAVRDFQAAYNHHAHHVDEDGAIAVDGAVGQQTWGAFYDLYMEELAALLEVGVDDLPGFFSKVSFLDDAKKAVGCGERFPVSDPYRDNYRSASDRRVDVLWFKPGRAPKLAPPQAGMRVADLGDVYAKRVFRITPVEVEPHPLLVTLDLQTVDELGFYAPNFELELIPDAGAPVNITTNDAGYWSGRISTSGMIGVWCADGRPTRYGADADEQTWDRPRAPYEQTVRIDPRVAARSITDVVVPGADPTVRQRRDELVRRYGRDESDRGETVRTGGGGGNGDEALVEPEPTGEQPSRGGTEPVFTYRTTGVVVADNLAIAAGWNDDYSACATDRLRSHLRNWITLHHPSVVARGYILHLFVGNQIHVFDNDDASLGTYPVDANNQIAGRFGAYAPFQYRPSLGTRLFTDMRTATGNIGIRHPDPNTDGADSNGDATDGGREEPPDLDADQPSGAMSISDVIAESHRQQYLDQTAGVIVSGARLEVGYIVPSAGNLIYIARTGGTGLLETYPDNAHESEVHERNLAVCRHSKMAFQGYIQNYIQRVRQTRDDEELWEMGPPQRAYVFPPPPGSDEEQSEELFDAQDAGRSELDAWIAIAEQLDRFAGMRPEGSFWMKCEFSLDPGVLGSYGAAQIKWNFEVDDDGRVTPLQTERTLTVRSGETGSRVEGEVNLETGEVKKKAIVNLGPYAFEFADDGEMKVSEGPIYAVANPRQETFGAGVEISFTDFLKRSWRRRNPGMTDEQMPGWLKMLPDAKLNLCLSFQSLRMGTVLAITSNAPGFFERRPVSSLMRVDWASLYIDEGHHLETLGWDRQTWDMKRRLPIDRFPESCRTRWKDLEAAEQVATVHLGLPAAEPHWKTFWTRIAAAPVP